MDRVLVAVVGAGFGGIGVGIRLRKAGVTDVVILERAGAVGGRSPAWVMPRRDRPISPVWQRLHARFPVTQKLSRLTLFLQKEATVAAFVRWPSLLRALQGRVLRHMHRTVTDPDLRAKLTPDYVLGCKRVLLSDDFYPALTRPNVRLVASGLAKVDGSVLTAQDGTTCETDAIVFATGFQVADTPMAQRIIGADGASLAAAWHDAGGATALRGTTVAGFPNLCLVTGPNTGLGHNSMIHIIESQLSYIEDYVRAVGRLGGAAALDARPAAQQRWNAGVQRRMARSVWVTGGCTSWYLSADGRNPAIWPGSTLSFRRATRRVDPAEYEIRPAR